MSVRVFYDILNQKGTPAMYTDTFANRPAYGYQGRLFISTDSGQIFEDTGSAWTLVADAGVGGGTLSSVCLNGNTTATGIVITAGGLSTNSLTNTSLTTGSILFADGGGLITQSNATFFWDNTNKRLGIGTASPGAPLDIHGTGTNAQFNGTGSNNAYLVFQNAGVSKWRIGNTYSAGANTFEIYNSVLSTSALSISNSSNALTINYSIFSELGMLIKNGSVLTATGYTGIGSTATSLLINLGNSGANSTLTFQTGGNYTYTFPATTGTIALTSNLSSYLPLSGGTLTGTLNGTSANFSQNVILDNGTSGIPLAFKQYSSSGFLGSNYTSLYALPNSLGINFGNPSASIILNTLTLSANRTITFPDVTGTLALTSDLSSYVPLAGNVNVTGALGINTTGGAGTTGLTNFGTFITRSDSTQGFPRQLSISMASGTLVQFIASGTGANYITDLGFYTSTAGGTNATPGIYITGTNNRVGIKTGTPAYDLDVAGTGNFSSELLLTSGQLAFSPNGGAPSTNVGFRYTGTFYVYPGTNGFNIRKNDNSTNVFAVLDSGNTLIGTTTDAGYKLDVAGVIRASGSPSNPNDATAGYFWNQSFVGPTISGGTIAFNTGSTGSQIEAMRILPGAYRKILFGNGLTTDFSAGHLCIQTDQTTENAIAIKNTSGANNGNYIVFVNSSGGGSGSITQTGATTVLYVATSDYRLKDNILPIENAINRILKIKPVTYNWKDTSNEKGEGFIAHELQEIVPLAVSGIKDDMNEDGTIKAQGIDYGKLTPLLVKAIQELNEKLVRNNIN